MDPALRAAAAATEQVLANLLENARRYPDGEPVIIRAR
jgi:signal transduction histidine kinase